MPPLTFYPLSTPLIPLQPDVAVLLLTTIHPVVDLRLKDTYMSAGGGLPLTNNPPLLIFPPYDLIDRMYHYN